MEERRHGFGRSWISGKHGGANRIGIVAWAAVLAAAVCLPGCDQTTRQQAQSTAGDALIAAQVRGKLAAVDAATLTLVHITSENGAVTLTGTVSSSAERAGIERAANSVQGVRSVTDRTTIDRNAPTGAQMESDLALAARIHGALAAQTGVNATRIHVDVHRGVVTLTGTLPSAAHRAVADQTVRATSGVTKLIDRITIANS